MDDSLAVAFNMPQKQHEKDTGIAISFRLLASERFPMADKDCTIAVQRRTGLMPSSESLHELLSMDHIIVFFQRLPFLDQMVTAPSTK